MHIIYIHSINFHIYIYICIHTHKHINILSFKMLSASRRRNFVKLTKAASKSIEILYI